MGWTFPLCCGIVCVLPQRGHYNGIRVGSAKNYGKETYERKEKRTDH